MLILTEISNKMINWPRFSKRLIVILVDLSLCILCTWLAFYLRLEKFISLNEGSIFLALISISLAIPIFWLFGLYRTIFRFGGQSLIFTVALAVGIYGVIYFLIIGIYVIQGIPRSIGVIQPLLLFFGISSSRMIIKYVFISSFFPINLKNKKKILIYGAGSAGRQILTNLENNPEMKVVGFLDDNPQYHNQLILGQTVYDPLKIKELIILKDIDLVLLALPLIKRAKRNLIIDYLNSFKITVKTLPTIQDIVDDKISFSDIKDLTVEDLLNREEVQPNLELLSKNIYSKVVLVSGAGGSIGSELCRQIIKLKPSKLLILELNEYALYKVNEDLKKIDQNIKIIPLLINVQNSSRLNTLFKTYKINTVYHTAAYKHVPLVEENICESVKNNVFGTFLIAQAALRNKVLNFVLISTDKAVRSTNVMGASKRLAEICVQSLHNDDKQKQTKFAIVRFGNVLQSSGSVIPKFKKQIVEGGPLTLTDPEVTRYFMTIKEASQLVIQAGAMSEGCEVFVLDMGKSVKIIDLIHKMIKLSGLTVKDSKNKDGDIEIKITGLRPGEKLYEELLLGDNPQKTFHEKIQKAQDPFISFNQLKIDLDILLSLLENNRVAEVKDMLNRLIPSFQSNSKIVDHIYKEQLTLKNEIKKTSLTNYKENKVISIKTT